MIKANEHCEMNQNFKWKNIISKCRIFKNKEGNKLGIEKDKIYKNSII